MASLVLFVCTGNICRSPMAEALLKATLPLDTPWRVTSAGLNAIGGGSASENAIKAIAETGGNLQTHRSQPLSPQLVQESTVIFVMTDAHAQILRTRFPSTANKLFLIRSFDPTAILYSNLDDPFCGTLEDYRLCRDQIRQTIPGIIAFLKTCAINQTP